MSLSGIKQMEQLAREDRDIISFSQGIPFTDSSEVIRNAVKQAMDANAVDKYSEPMGILSLRQALSTALQKESMHYAPTEILVTAGAVEAMASTVLALTNPGDEIIIPSPTYSSFFAIADVAKLTIIPLQLREETGWSLDLSQLEQCISPKTKAVLLCNPNNPTGSVYPKETLLGICELARKHNLYIFLDEVYGAMLYDRASLFHPSTIAAYRRNIVRIVSFSKDFSLTGWRIGYLHTDITLLPKILTVHDSLVNCAPVISQYAALAALGISKEMNHERLELYVTQRKLMGAYLEQLSGVLSYTYPQGTYFFFPRMHTQIPTRELCLDIVRKVKVAVVPGETFGLGGGGHIRLCFGRKASDIVQGMERLVHYFA